MKLLASLSLLSLLSLAGGSVSASDFKDKLLNAAKDKKNQEQAKEVAQKGIEYIKGEKKEEAKPEVAPVPAPAPVAEKDAKSSKTSKKKTKKKKS